MLPAPRIDALLSTPVQEAIRHGFYLYHRDQLEPLLLHWEVRVVLLLCTGKLRLKQITVPALDSIRMRRCFADEVGSAGPKADELTSNASSSPTNLREQFPKPPKKGPESSKRPSE
jgi:hypothetical protein